MGAIQKYYCKKCQKYFSERRFPGTKHPPRVIFSAITLYNLGHTLSSVSEELRKRHHVIVTPSTVHSWIIRYSDVCNFQYMRRKYTLDPAKAILSRRFEHEQVYYFRMHALKTNIIGKSQPGLGGYLYDLIKGKVPKGFGSGKRCSEAAKLGLLPSITTRSVAGSIAPVLCEMGLETAAHNRQRHDAVERFFLINDSATVACEVPVYASAEEIAKVIPDWSGGKLHGHIDILQNRGGNIVIMDYKPEMADERFFTSQLALYALLLSIRTGVPIDLMKCGYFNERVSKEFYPANALGKGLVRP